MTAPGTLSAIRILVVDDESLARQRLRALLAKRPDFEVVDECATGAEAVKAIRTLKPDIVLLDVQMPELDGFGLAAALLEDERTQQLRFVFTGDPDPCTEAQAYEAGALGFLAKPFDPRDFGLFVNRALAHLAPRRNSAVADPSALSG